MAVAGLAVAVLPRTASYEHTALLKAQSLVIVGQIRTAWVAVVILALPAQATLTAVMSMGKDMAMAMPAVEAIFRIMVQAALHMEKTLMVLPATTMIWPAMMVIMTSLVMTSPVTMTKGVMGMGSMPTTTAQPPWKMGWAMIVCLVMRPLARTNASGLSVCTACMF